jgi:hypothetical protein
MWPMPTEVPLFITAKWAITTDTCPINAALKSNDLEPSKAPCQNLIQQIDQRSEPSASLAMTLVPQAFPDFMPPRFRTDQGSAW